MMCNLQFCYDRHMSEIVGNTTPQHIERWSNPPLPANPGIAGRESHGTDILFGRARPKNAALFKSGTTVKVY